MLAIKLWNYLKGYVIIRIKGLSLERLLNLALANDIYLWNVKRFSHIELGATVSVNGYKNLDILVKKLGCKVEIIERKGLPFLLAYLRKRKMILIGLFIFIIIITFLSSMVWEISIIGGDQVPHDELIYLLESHNYKIARFKRTFDKEKIESLIINEYDFITFLDTEISGVKFLITIKEEDLPPEKIDKSYPANIIARKKGLIKKIVARKGKALVNKGEIVEAGDLLITGLMDSDLSDEIHLVHAEGEVLAQTRYISTKEENIIEFEEKETGNIYKQRGIKIGNKGVRFLVGEIPFKNYIEEVEEKSIVKFKAFKLPIKLVTNIFKEVELKEIKRDIEYLKNKSHIMAIDDINQELADDSEIISKEITHDIRGNILRTRAVVEVLEDISKVQIINN